MNAAFLFIGNMGIGELIIILFVGLLLFGRRLPEISRSLGRSVVEFKRGFQDIEKEIRDVDRSTDQLAREANARQIAATQAPVSTPSPTATPVEVLPPEKDH
jgi:sec-independent protein translocase protein TatA